MQVLDKVIEMEQEHPQGILVYDVSLFTLICSTVYYYSAGIMKLGGEQLVRFIGS